MPYDDSPVQDAPSGTHYSGNSLVANSTPSYSAPSYSAPGASPVYSGFSSGSSSNNLASSASPIALNSGYSFGGSSNNYPNSAASFVTAPWTSPSAAPTGGNSSVNSTFAPLSSGQQSSLFSTAQSLGANPSDLYAVMNYVTNRTFDPGKVGGKDDAHVGLLQFGPSEQKKYGVSQDQTFDEQLDAAAKYLKDRGFKPGMGLDHMYSIVNAGSLKKNGEPRYNARDQNASIREHISQIQQHFYPSAPANIAALSAPPTTDVPPNPTLRPYKQGDKSPDIAPFQQALAERGFYTDAIDGSFGPKTRAAVNAARQNAGMSLNGLLDSDLQARLTGNAAAAPYAVAGSASGDAMGGAQPTSARFATDLSAEAANNAAIEPLSAGIQDVIKDYRHETLPPNNGLADVNLPHPIARVTQASRIPTEPMSGMRSAPSRPYPMRAEARRAAPNLPEVVVPLSVISGRPVTSGRGQSGLPAGSKPVTEADVRASIPQAAAPVAADHSGILDSIRIGLIQMGVASPETFGWTPDAPNGLATNATPIGGPVEDAMRSVITAGQIATGAGRPPISLTGNAEMVSGRPIETTPEPIAAEPAAVAPVSTAPTDTPPDAAPVPTREYTEPPGSVPAGDRTAPAPAALSPIDKQQQIDEFRSIYKTLPPGAIYTDPNGVTRRKGGKTSDAGGGAQVASADTSYAPSSDPNRTAAWNSVLDGYVNNGTIDPQQAEQMKNDPPPDFNFSPARIPQGGETNHSGGFKDRPNGVWDRTWAVGSNSRRAPSHRRVA